MDVVHVDIQEGPKGGRYWFMTLACGHHAVRHIPKPRPWRGQIYRRGMEPPNRARCLLCETPAADIHPEQGDGA